MRTAIYSLVLAVMLSMSAHADDLKNSPPGFTVDDKDALFIDITKMKVDMTFDVAEEKALGHARIEFYAYKAGYPVLDLVPDATSVVLNGKEIGGAEALKLVDVPDKKTKLRMVQAKVEKNTRNVLEIDYQLLSKHVTFTETGVRIGWFMLDVSSDRSFLEQYAPSNLEYDTFELEATMKVKGASRAHQLFTNGKVVESTEDTWQIKFPSYYTTSSFYLHLTDADLKAKEEVFEGVAAKIPVTVYSSTESSTAKGMEKTLKVLKELEETYGAFAHEKVVVYVAGAGGMEYCGATMTSLSALDHELTHSYFARGVMPVNGNSGWIDEAIASWRDNGYPKAKGEPTGSKVNLAAFSPYVRTTPFAAYTDGAKLMSVFDYLFTASGLKPVLKDLFTRHQHQGITTPQFSTFLETTVKKDLHTYFDKYVYNKGDDEEDDNHNHWMPVGINVPGVPTITHPRPYTMSELVQFR